MGKYAETYDMTSKPFKGTKQNDVQARKYEHLKMILAKLKRLETPIFEIRESVKEMNNSERNGLIYFDVDNPMTAMDQNQRMAIAEMILTADDFIVANVGSEAVRFSFGVRDIWE